VTSNPTDGPIHRRFSLSYSNYLVLNRTLLQSMPIDWQERFTDCLDQFNAAFEHVQRAEGFEVHAATEHEVGDLTDAQRAALGITKQWYDEDEPTDLHGSDLADWREEHELPDAPVYRDAAGQEIDAGSRVALRCEDPVPHYRHAYIEPHIQTDPNCGCAAATCEICTPISHNI